MTRSTLDEVAEQYGLGLAYHDYRGELKVFSAATKIALLSAMGVDASGWPALEKTLGATSSGVRARTLPPVLVLHQGETDAIEYMPGLKGARTFDWQLTTESGATSRGTVNTAALSDAAVHGPSSQTAKQWQLPLTAELPVGYHHLTVRTDFGASEVMLLVQSPPRCFAPPALVHGQRLWGITLQLYTLRSASNWGIGDFADLEEVIESAAPLGCALIGLNPLHALMPADPSHNSPYSPSSRQFLNVLYISVPRVPEFAHCDSAQTFANQTGTEKLAQLRAGSNVDYVAVAELKLHWLRILHRQFCAQRLAGETARVEAFRQFVASGGEPLRLHAVFDALHAYLRKQSLQYGGWPSWPEKYRDPRSDEVGQFVLEHATEVDFYLYLQWQAAVQLAEAQRLAEQKGMKIGLYGDVAVGVSAGGSETWSNPTLYVTQAGIGAPPDPLALKGQDWGIPPQNPRELKEQRYQAFIDLLRFNMSAVGALRLDHVMALFRQWWVPRGSIATEGAYVHYPLDDLMGILCLESHRNQCLVIGEDLGTVPDEVRVAMHRYAVAHYKVLLFEKEPDGRFKPPAAYERLALAAVTTHDLPTFRGWWESVDVGIAARLNLYPDASTRQQVEAARAADRRNLMMALVAAGLWHWQQHEELPGFSQPLLRAAHLYLGLSNAELAVVQIEDLAGMSDPVNVPGTHTEYPNWQRKVTQTVLEIFDRPDVRELLGAMSIARTGRNPN
jgi:4-alpha-glucanotransferase